MSKNISTNLPTKGNPPAKSLGPPAGFIVPNTPQKRPQAHLPDTKDNKPIFSVTYNYVRGRQLEGTYNNDPKIGYWPITALRISRGWGAPLQEEWPDSWDAASWPPEEPPNMDRCASIHKIFAYQRIRSSIECEQALSAGSAFVSVDMTNLWANSKNGKIKLPSKDDEINARHAFCIVGCNNRKKEFKFQNSWGIKWGDQGYGYLPYEYFDRLLNEAWIIILHEDLTIPKTMSGVVKRVWSIRSILHGILHGIELRDSQSNDRIAWSFATQYDGHLNVEELFVRPTYRGKCYSTDLIFGLLELSSRLSLPLTFWVSHVDNNAANMVVIKHLADRTGYAISESGARWAAFKVEQSGLTSCFTQIRIKT